MKWIIWSIGGVLAAVWTAALALVALVVGWAGDLLQRAGPAAPGEPAAAAGLPAAWPAWVPDGLQAALAGWVDPATWAALVEGARQALAFGQSLLPAIGSVGGWIEAAVWGVWCLGMIALLVVAAISHGLLARRPAMRPAAT